VEHVRQKERLHGEERAGEKGQEKRQPGGRAAITMEAGEALGWTGT
jgi:hypothetical protein